MTKDDQSEGGGACVVGGMRQVCGGGGGVSFPVSGGVCYGPGPGGWSVMEWNGDW